MESLSQENNKLRVQLQMAKKEAKNLRDSLDRTLKAAYNLALENSALKSEKGALALECHKEIDYSDKLQKKIDKLKKGLANAKKKKN